MTGSDESLRLHSGEYVSHYEQHSMARVTRLASRMELGGDEVLADFACGNAMLLQATHDRVRHYHGIDFSPDFIQAAERRAHALGVSNASFHCNDIVDYCASRHGCFDVAAALDFCEHIDDGEFVRVFSAIRSSLRDSGRLYLHTPNLDFLLEQLKHHGILPQFPQHIAVRDANRLIQLLETCGFSRASIQVTALAHYNAMRIVHPLRKLPGIGRLFAARLFIECRK